MELGQRLKQERLAQGISQRQLCGEEITRNMLSQIENGSARPSMATLEYLARRLGKPVSYFLEEQVSLSPNQQVMIKMRKAYQAEAWDEIPALLESYSAPDEVFDEERYLLEALALMALAKEALAQGKPLYARKLLAQSGEAGARGIYYTEALERERLLILYAVQPEQAAELAERLPKDEREQFLRAQAAQAAGESAKGAAILESISERTPRWYFLRGEIAEKMREYSLAVRCYHQAEEAYPGECAKALEACYRELEDYKQAYYYACKQRKP